MMGRKAARNMYSSNTNKTGIQYICWFYSQGTCYDVRSYDLKIHLYSFYYFVFNSVTTCFCRTKGGRVDLRRAFLCMLLFSLAPHHPTNTLYSSISDLEVCVRSYIILNIWPSGKSPNRNQLNMKEDTIIFLQDKWNFEKDVTDI